MSASASDRNEPSRGHQRQPPSDTATTSAQARRIADHVALFWVQSGAGRVIEHGPVAQIFEAPREELTASYVSGIRG